MAVSPKVVVIGASVFGGWTALSLLREGYDVTLCDSWGAGNSRASSGGETRVMRCIHGGSDSDFYTTLANRAFDLWLENEPLLGRKILFPTGCLWFIDGSSESIMAAAIPIIEREGLNYEKLSLDNVVKKYPQINPQGLSYVVHEQKAGYLLAREGCAAVKEAFVRSGGAFITAQAKPKRRVNGRLASVELSNGRRIGADIFVFACGPWLKQLFPETVGKRLKITRQDVFYFGLPQRKTSHYEESLPVWIDYSAPDFYYGIPGGISRGFKVAFDRRGREIDPTGLERQPSKKELEKARDYLTKRFHGLKGVPLTESRVCQYSDTEDGNFIFDQHPELDNLWILGGGSGHGYKHGPALGELVSQVLNGRRTKLTNLRLSV